MSLRPASVLPFAAVPSPSIFPRKPRRAQRRLLLDSIEERILCSSTIAGNVYVDGNGNGQFDSGAGEVGLGQMQVSLTGTTSGGTAVNLTTTTDRNGAWTFTVPDASNASGWTITALQYGAFEDRNEQTGTGGGTNPANDTFNIVLADGQAVTGYNFGEVIATTGSCFVIGDSGGIGAGNDIFVVYDETTQTTHNLGNTLGTNNVEGMVYVPHTDTLYAVNQVSGTEGRIGTVSQTTGLFTALPNPVGSGNGALGLIDFVDLDGITVDPFDSSLVYAEVRRGGNDVLIRVDLTTGQRVANAFGVGVDYVELRDYDAVPDPDFAGLDDIDDITIDPADGQMYGVLNTGGNNDRLVLINRTTGDLTDIGLLRDTAGNPIGDVEGLGFTENGVLMATTGSGAVGANDNMIWALNKATGQATVAGVTLGPIAGDTEAVACNVSDINRISGVVFYDINSDGVFNGADIGQTPITVQLYRDLGTIGVRDAFDVLLSTRETTVGGAYEFVIAANGAFILDVQAGDLPAAANYTTPTAQAADFGLNFGLSDTGNNFGYDLPVVVSQSIFSTSETSTTGNNVGIGEIVTYRLTVSLPEAPMPGFSITPNLPAGMAYVPGSVQLFASHPGGTDPALNAAHPGTGTAAYNGTGLALPGVTGGAFANGTDPTFTFAATNTAADSNANNNTFYITYQAVVLDVTSNVGINAPTTTLTNPFTYSINGSAPVTGLIDPAGVTATVLEPNLSIDKTVTVNGGTVGDAGDTVNYTVAIAHTAASNEDAFDVTYRDPLPTQFTTPGIGAVTVTHSALGDITSRFEIVNGVLQTIAGQSFDLLVGQTVTVAFSTTLNTTVQPGQGIDSPAQIRYSNLDTDRTATGGYNPSGDVTTDQERSYFTSDVSPITTPPAVTVTKTLISTSEPATTGNKLLIGEIARYQITARLVEGTTQSLSLRDLLPTGMQFLIDGPVTVSYSGVNTSVTGLAAGTYTNATLDSLISASATTDDDNFGDGTDVFFNLGTLINNDNDAGDETVSVAFNILTLNTAPNGTGTTLNNTATSIISGGLVAGATDLVSINTATGAVTTLIRDVASHPVINRPGASINSLAYDDVNHQILFGDSLTQNLYRYDLTTGAVALVGNISSALAGVLVSPALHPTTGNDIGSYNFNGGATFYNGRYYVQIEFDSPGAAPFIPAHPVGFMLEVTLNGTGTAIASTSIHGGTASLPMQTWGRPLGIGNLGDIAVNPDTGLAWVTSSDEIGGAGVVGVDHDFGFMQLNLAAPAPITSLSRTVTGGQIAFYEGNLYRNPLATGSTFDIIDQTTGLALSTLNLSQSITVFDMAHYNSRTVAAAAGVDVEICSPSVTLVSKTLNTAATADAGDTVSYSITLTNTSVAPAYDVSVADSLSAFFNAPTVSIQSATPPAVGTDPVAQTVSFGGGAINLTRLDPGQSITILLTTTLTNATPAGQTIGNSATLTAYSSLPGTGTPLGANNPTGSITPGASGATNGERLLSGGTVNAANVVINRPAIDQQFRNQDVANATSSNGTQNANVTIGETVAYDIVVTLPEGTTRDLILRDLIPSGLTLISSEVITQTGTGAGQSSLLTQNFNGTVTTAPTQGAAGALTTFSFGDTVTVGDNVAGNNSFVLRLVVRADNSLANQTGLQLTADASLIYDDPTLGNDQVVDDTTATDADATPNDPTVTIAEPHLNYVTAIASTSTGNTNDLQAGDTVTYSVSITNDGNSTSFDTLFAATAPTGLSITGFSAVTLGGGATIDSALTISGGGTGLSGQFDIPVGGSAVFTFTATLGAGVTPGTTYAVTTETTYTSLNAPDANERTGVSPALQDDTALNNYRVLSSLPISTTTGLTLDKTSSTPTAQVGDVVTFTLTIDVFEGTLNNVQLADVLPAGMLFQAGSVTVTPSAGITTGYVNEATSVVVSGQNLTISLGSVTNPAGGGDTVTVTYQALVQNVAGNQSGTDLTNNAQATATGVPPSTDTTTVVVREPVLDVVKTLVTSGSDAGDAVQYTIVITNVNGANAGTAFDINVLDVLESEIALTNTTLGSGIVVAGAAVSANTSTTSSLNLVLASLAPGASATITLNAVVVAAAPAGSTVGNATTITWTSTTGANPNERNGTGGINDYSDSATAANFVLATPLVDKLTPADTTYSIGEQVTYDILVTVPEGVTQAVSITDNLPAGLNFISAAIQTAAGGSLGTAFAGTAPTISATNNVGNAYTFTLGNITATNDNNAANNSFLVRVTAQVANVVGNQNAVILTNTATLAYTNATTGVPTTVNDPTPNVDITIVEPVLTLVKDALGTTTNLDAGDTVQYRIVITNTGTATAHETLLSDALPAGLLITSIDSTTPAGGAITDTPTAGVGTAALSGEYTIPAGGSITILYTATLQSSVTPGTNYTNTATITYTSVNGTALGQGTPTGERNGSGGINDYTTSDPATISTAITLAVDKTANVTTANIGDVITYSVLVTLNEGTSNNVVVTDTLPANGDLQFVAGSAAISFATAGSSISGSTVPAISGANSNVLTFSLGSVVIPAGASANTFTLTYQVVVRNVASNQAGDNETNSARVTATNLTPVTDTTTVLLREPVLGVVKTLVTPGSDAGDAVQYTITVSNATGANVGSAYDIRVTDLLPATLSFSSFTIAGATVTTNANAGNQLDLTLDTLAPGASATITVNAVVAAGAPAGATIGNSATITYTSTPGANPNERNGSGGINDHTASSTAANFVLATPLVDKLTPADTTYSIGEQVTYDILVTVPEGVTQAVSITDNLPAGLNFISAAIQTAAGGSLSTAFAGTAPTISATNNVGNAYTFTLGNITATNDNNAANNSFLVRVTAQVANVVGNQDTVVLTNTATLAYTNATTGLPTTVNDLTPNVDITIVEPVLTLVKDALGTTTNLDAGDTVQYRIVITNTGTATAHETLLSDALPAGLLITSIDSTTPAGGATTDTATAGVGTAALSGEYTIPVGGSITILYTATLQSSVTPGTNYTNTATITYTSVNGTALGQGTPTGERNGSGGINDYTTSDPATISTGGVLTISKGVDNATPTIGDVLTYTVTLTLNEGTTNGIVVTDTLPTNGDLQFVAGSAAVAFGTAGSSVSGSAIPVVSGANSNVLTFTLGSAVIPAGAGANTVTLTYQVRVANVTINQAGDSEINSASVTATGLPTPPPGTTTVTLREPTLTFDKTNNASGVVSAGDTVTYTLTIANPGGANSSTAFDSLVRDAMPADILITSIIGTTLAGGATVDSAAAITGGGTGLSGQFDIPVNGSVVISYVGTVQVTAPLGSTQTNTAEVTWTSLNGGNSLTPDAGERFGAAGQTLGNGSLNDYRLVDSTAVTVGVATFDKQLFSTSDAATPGSNVAIGETVTYALVVTLPAGTAPSLTIVDTLPVGLQYLSSSLVTTAAGSNGLLSANFSGSVNAPTVTGGATDGDDVTFSFGTLSAAADGNSSNNTFLVLINARVTDIVGNEGILPGQTTLPNSAQFDIPGNPPGNPPPVNVTVIEPVLTIDKEFNVTQADAGDTVQVSIVVSNTGNGPAHDVVVTDIVDTTRFGSIAAVTTPAGFVFNNTTGTVTYTGGPIAAGGSATFVFSVQLLDAVGPNEMLNNTATATATSQPGVVPGERSYGPVQDTDSLLVPPVFTVTKGITSPLGGTVQIGDVVTYSVNVTLVEGTTNNITLTDLLPTGTSFVAGSAVVSNTGGMTVNGFAANLVGQTLTMSATSVVNPGNVDNAATTDSDTFTITYQVVVNDVAGNAAGTLLTNSLTGTGTNVPPSNPPPVTTTVVEPTLRVIKAANDNTPDLGQSVHFTLTITNLAGANAATAYDIIVRDALPAGLSGLSGILVNGVAVGASGLVDENNSTGAQLDLKLSQLAVGGAITVEFDAVVGTATALLGSVIDNNARIYWDSQPGESTNSVLTGVADGNGDRDYGATGADESFDQDTQGAQDTERLTVNAHTVSGFVYLDGNTTGTFNGGDTGQVGVTVTLTGTDFLNRPVSLTTDTIAGGAYSFTNVAAGTYTITRATTPMGTTDALENVGSNYGGTESDALGSVVISGLNLPVNTTNSGANYNFGLVTASSLTTTVYADDNNDGAINGTDARLQNQTVVFTGTDIFGQPVSLTGTTDVNGNITFDNAGVGLRPGTYRLDETQPAGFLDGLNTTGTGATNNGATINTPPSDAITGIVLDQGQAATGFLFGELRPASISGVVYLDVNNDGSRTGETGISGITITLSGTDDLGAVLRTINTGLDGSYSFGNLRPGTYTVTETQSALYTDGLDTLGTGFSAPNNAGTAANDVFSNIVLTTVTTGNNTGVEYNFGERPLPTPVGITKAIISTSETATTGSTVAIGETVTYALNIAVSDGTTRSLSVTDFLPAGMSFLSATVDFTGSGVTPFTLPAPTLAGNNVTFAIGDVVNPADANAANDSFTILLTALVSDVLGNVRTTTLVNDASVTWDDPLNGVRTVNTPADPVVTVAEPALQIVKAVNDATPDLGQTITYTLTISHTAASDADAFDIRVRDAIPSGVTLLPGSLVVTGATVTGNSSTASLLDFTLDTLADNGSTITVTYQATINNVLSNVGATLDNNARIYWDSLDADEADNAVFNNAADSTPDRDYGATPGLIEGVNDTTDLAQDSERVVVNTNSISGTVYRDVDVSNSFNMGDVRIALPAGVTLNLTGTSLTGLTVNRTVITTTGDYTFDLLPAGNYTITQIQPAGFIDAAETAGVPFGGTVSAAANSNTITAINIPANLAQAGTDYNFGERLAPDLYITKDDGVQTVRPGDTVNYTMIVRNRSLQNATDVVVTDALPEGLVFVSANNGGTYDPITRIITWNLGQVDGSNTETVTLTIQATVVSPVPAGLETIDNIVRVTDRANPGTDPTPDDNFARDLDVLRAAPDLYVSKTDNLITAKVSQTITYTLTGGNAGDQTAQGVIIRDTLPPGLRFVAASNGGTFSNGEIVWQAGDMKPGDTFSFTITAVVEKSASGKTLENVATIADRFGSPDDPTPKNNRSTDTTRVPNVPPPAPTPTFIYDRFNNFSRDRQRDPEPLGFYEPLSSPEIAREPMLPLPPIYSGESDPGSLLTINLYNSRGEIIGSQTVVVDSGGNWMTTFPSSAIKDTPNSVTIIQTAPSYSTGAGTGFNTRAYYSPAINPGHFFHELARSSSFSDSAPLLRGLIMENTIGSDALKYAGDLLTRQAVASGF